MTGETGMRKLFLIGCVSLGSALWAQDAAEVDIGDAAIGKEVNLLEERADPLAPAIPDLPPPPPPPPPLLLPPPGGSPKTEGDFEVKTLDLKGDLELLEERGLLADLQALEGSRQPVSDIEMAIQTARSKLHDQGLFLADIAPTFKKDGTLELLVDQGRVGEVNYFELPSEYPETTPAQRSAQREPYDGHFGRNQLDGRLEMRAGEAFNYNHLHRNLVAANAHPDMLINTDLKIRREEVDGTPQRYIDMDLYVQDRFPLHGVIEYKNTGTEHTEDDRLLLTLQHFNLTKRDDSLTVHVPLSAPDVQVLQAIASSYIVPVEGGGISLFGGGSRLDIDELVPNLNLESTGWFVGTRGFRHLMDTDRRTLNLAAGATYRVIDETLDLIDSPDDEESSVGVLPIALSLVYNDKVADELRGRSFLTAVTSYNVGGPLGVTDEDDLALQRPGGERDYWVHSLQLARIQGLGGTFDPRGGGYPDESYLFLLLNGQYSADPLLAAEQLVAGGLETVRGYPERDVSGDRGFHGKLELRSPILRGLVTRQFVDKKNLDEMQKQPIDYFQLVTFMDFGRTELIATEHNEPVEHDLLSVGVGLRFSLTKYSQFKLSYGWPLEDTPNSDEDGRFHFSLQAQF